ncbi:hypothetical protein MC3_04060 [Rickettsia slovaca str. D-CWPP]|uniref:Uncharacterized protein n=2 Tax=Rickettsia slovaca TaxID=35794 RepID=H8LMI9_RICSL|nr:Hypothetical protein Rsl_838 [Rickettsia slovaca 13-B]AFD19735.1 hypothetical protein MC3_04060 [Rickettsia slovaca str. D-CWPP]
MILNPQFTKKTAYYKIKVFIVKMKPKGIFFIDLGNLNG